ncbi:TRAP transporter large permease [Aestuariivirga sp.]|uniref:TRAP transporter large permease n=1 Tax=Aestuariivirga sp. TaxID=2650926 RepID=UPI003BAAC4AC
MIDLLAQNLAPLMFVALIAFLLLGYPVAFALAANGLLFFVIAVELSPYSNEISLSWPLLMTMPGRILDVMRNDTLLAIPFFTFMGIVLEKSGMAEDLLDTIGQLFGPVRGGLAFAVVLVGALLAATTGVVAASVMAMGLISLPIMLRYGYDRSLAAGVIAASGTLAQIIPPSLVLIVLADQLGRSVGDLYSGALIPGLLLTAVYCAYIAILAIVKPASVPALPIAARRLSGSPLPLLGLALAALVIAGGSYLVLASWVEEGAGIWAATLAVIFAYGFAAADGRLGTNLLSVLARQVVFVLIPPLALIFLVLGTIFLGIATPTEGGAMGATGALVLALARRRFGVRQLSDALEGTARLSCFVIFVLIGSRIFSLTFYGINGHLWVEHLFLGLPGGAAGFLVAVNLLVFILGCFVDFFEIAFIVVPLLAPVAAKLGIDLVWFGVILGMNLQTSFLTPPFGFALFYMRSVAPAEPFLDKASGRMLAGVSTGQIYRGAVSFILLQIIMIGIVVAFPALAIPTKAPEVDPATIDIQIPESSPGGGGETDGVPPPPSFD